MLAVLEFVTRDLPTFFMTIVLLIVIFVGLADVFRALRGRQ